jgi:hypothetical protein
MQKMWQRRVPMLLLDQFVSDQQVAAQQCDPGGKGKRGGQLREVLGFASFTGLPIMPAVLGDANGFARLACACRLDCRSGLRVGDGATCRAGPDDHEGADAEPNLPSRLRFHSRFRFASHFRLSLLLLIVLGES